MMNPSDLLKGYDTQNLSVGSLGGHSALDVLHGAKKYGFHTVCVAREGRDKTYNKYYKSRGTRGCIDDVISVPAFENVLDEQIQQELRDMNTIFAQSRYFWVYFEDYAKVENDFHVPIFGNRTYVKIEERDQKFTQYDLLQKAGIRIPKIFKKAEDMDGRLCIIKASEKQRGYERAFFLASNKEMWESEGTRLENEGLVGPRWRNATIEEFVVGAHVNFNFFYSPLLEELELLGTDTRRQTNLDGFLRMTANQQLEAMKHIPVKLIETGHSVITIKESLLEKAFELGEQFVQATKEYDGKGIIGPFALQGAIVAEEGKEDFVCFDVSLRIPGSPGTRFTPYTDYLHGEHMSCGERIAMEIRQAVKEGRLEEVVT
jgi:5-formaminoimidazole-4-carboxamide-1-(beta)-D-ribofuranosyl 5'-monophosphate synthetase